MRVRKKPRCRRKSKGNEGGRGLTKSIHVDASTGTQAERRGGAKKERFRNYLAEGGTKKVVPSRGEEKRAGVLKADEKRTDRVLI